MSRPLTVEDSVVIAADADTIYLQLADPSQMGRWSPENHGAEVPSPGEPATAGTVFVGSNKRGRARWVTRCRVTDAEPGVRFGFDVLAIGARVPRLRGRIAHWEYTLEPVPDDDGGGTRVTERWTDLRRGWPDRVAAVFDRAVTGGDLFSDFQRRNIATTLANLKADLDAGS